MCSVWNSACSTPFHRLKRDGVISAACGSLSCVQSWSAVNRWPTRVRPRTRSTALRGDARAYRTHCSNRRAENVPFLQFGWGDDNQQGSERLDVLALHPVRRSLERQPPILRTTTAVRRAPRQLVERPSRPPEPVSPTSAARTAAASIDPHHRRIRRISELAAALRSRSASVRRTAVRSAARWPLARPRRSPSPRTQSRVPVPSPGPA